MLLCIIIPIVAERVGLGHYVQETTNPSMGNLTLVKTLGQSHTQAYRVEIRFVMSPCCRAL